MSEVVAHRQEAAQDALRAYKVRLDGANVGDIRSGTSWRHPVEEGMHTSRLTIDWKGGDEITFAVARDDTIEFNATAQGPVWTAPLRVLSGKPWIALTKVN